MATFIGSEVIQLLIFIPADPDSRNHGVGEAESIQPGSGDYQIRQSSSQTCKPGAWDIEIYTEGEAKRSTCTAKDSNQSMISRSPYGFAL